MNVAVIGTGYVGLVAGACFARGGNRVTCVDIDARKVERLRQGIIPIYEPGLDELVREGVASDRLHFTTDAGSAVAEARTVFIAVGTPPQEDGSADLSHVLKVARTIRITKQREGIANVSLLFDFWQAYGRWHCTSASGAMVA